jgi:tetratricopeptide (TPR) repeat protein
MKMPPHVSAKKLPKALPQTLQGPSYEVTLLLAQGLALHQDGRLTDAELIYRKILALQPDHFDSLHFLGVMAHQRGNHAKAVDQISRALKRDPKNAFALSNRGNALLALRRLDGALADYDAALAALPDYADALCNRGAALHELERYEEALASSDRAIALRPDYHEAHANRGNTLNEMRRFAEALASCDRGLALRPDYAEAHLNRGNALHELKRFDEALASYDRALELRPDYAEALTNRGVSLHDLKRFDEALASYQRAIAVRPDHAEAHYREAMCRLLNGDYQRGWHKQEWRWQSRPLKNARRSFAQRLWLGAEPLAGKTILLHAEQGFGDTIQFCRYVPLVAERSGRVIVEVQKPLRELVSTLPGGAQVVSRGERLPAFDRHCPLLSLPLALGTIPSAAPYLRASEQAAGDWAVRLGARTGASTGDRTRPRIGIAWAGSAAHRNDHNRSIPLGALLSCLAGVDAGYVSLQPDLRGGDAAMLQARRDVLHFGDELKDFSDTAALIANLDLIISVDTSVAHLAGALAKPVWLLVPVIPDWRWLLDRDDSPWYPTARLFRQDDSRRWDGVLARVNAALHDHVRSL